MNIQQLRYVVATVDHGSMTAAAAAVFVAQPALSRAIRHLERELGITIFERSGRGVTLSPEGAELVRRARGVLASIDALQSVASTTDHAAPLVIAASPTLQAALAVPILAALRDHGVAMPSRLVGCSSSAEVVDLVTAGTADLGICDSAVTSDLVQVTIGRAEIRLYSPVALELPDRVRMADLAGLPLVLPTAGSKRRAALDGFFARAGVVPEVAVETDERNVWLAAVTAGLASCIWHSVEAARAPVPGVVVRSFDPPIHRPLTTVHRAGDASPALGPLLEVVRQMSALVG
ncbi:LysR family transcriptional regulator [Nocardioides sp. WS12]|uniref:LysR family transcriptional regulator n=1 Tax=Nocardioides sp. WS12 TaxID=2486272 RepID=UPI0015FC5AF0|nr:LysR family transcriptional regulator [Nocardioides sp. WS12]